MRGLNRRLKKAKGTWLEEVPQILWAYHTTPQSITNLMPLLSHTIILIMEIIINNNFVCVYIIYIYVTYHNLKNHK